MGKEGSAPRARPPQWSQEVLDVFFDDAREQLVGDRPDFSASMGQVAAVAEGTSNEKGQAWSTLIDVDALTTEIKRVVNQIARTVLREGAFKSEGHRLCQRDFRLLAIWFGVVVEFEEEVRWQQNAGAMRDYLIDVAENCEEGNDKSLAAAQEASEVLAELMRGQSPTLPSPSSANPTEEATDLGDSMQRMKQAAEEKIAPALVRGREFRKGRNEIAHEAQILAVLARIARQEGFGYSDDEVYLEYTRQLEQAAVDLGQAARNGDFEAAEQAGGRLKQSCVSCHEDYRG